MIRTVMPLVLTGTLALAGCGSVWSARSSRDQGTGVTSQGSGTVLSSTALSDYGGTLLRAMIGKVPNLKVRHLDLARCPAITLRSHQEVSGANFPDVYVDAIRATDTCILQTLQARDVERVEVYPQGVTSRPGYGTHAEGLILVFMRR